MKKIKHTKRKLVALVVVGCMAITMPVMAFNKNVKYMMDGYDSEYITGVISSKTTVYLNTRPSSGGDVLITLEGAANTSATFPYRTSRDDWKVTVTANEQLDIWGYALSPYTTDGFLHVWD